MNTAKNVNMNEIAERLVKVKVSVSGWYGNVQSTTGRQELANLHGAESDAVSAGVSMLPKNVTDKIRKHTIGIRDLVKKHSLPFQDGGYRIMAAKDYNAMNKQLQVLREDYRQFVYDEIYDKYDELVEIAQRRLNGLFRADRFPNKENILYKYGMTAVLDPIASVENIHISGLTKAEIEEIKVNTTREYSNQLAAGQKELLNNLSGIITNIMGKTSKENARYKGAIRNLVELCESIQNLNYLDNPEVNEIADEVKEKFGNIQADTIKESVKVQKKVHKDGADLIEKLANIAF